MNIKEMQSLIPDVRLVKHLSFKKACNLSMSQRLIYCIGLDRRTPLSIAKIKELSSLNGRTITKDLVILSEYKLVELIDNKWIFNSNFLPVNWVKWYETNEGKFPCYWYFGLPVENRLTIRQSLLYFMLVSLSSSPVRPTVGGLVKLLSSSPNTIKKDARHLLQFRLINSQYRPILPQDLSSYFIQIERKEMSKNRTLPNLWELFDSERLGEKVGSDGEFVEVVFRAVQRKMDEVKWSATDQIQLINWIFDYPRIQWELAFNVVRSLLDYVTEAENQYIEKNKLTYGRYKGGSFSFILPLLIPVIEKQMRNFYRPTEYLPSLEDVGYCCN